MQFKKLLAITSIITVLSWPALVIAGGSPTELDNYVASDRTYTQQKELKTDYLNSSKENSSNQKPESILSKFLWSVIGGIIGALIALWLEKFKDPDLKIEVSESANSFHNYPNGYVVPGEWKFFRVRVVNRPLPRYLSWIMSREVAENVRAQISFREINQTMKGRWSGTLELPFTSPSDQMRLANFPDPETIFVGDHVLLDIFAKHDGDNEAYGWNNEAYLNAWRTAKYKLNPGDYSIEVKIMGINAEKKIRLKAHIAKTIKATTVTEKK